MNYWLMKTEPGTYSWNDLLKDGQAYWDGVRNYQARNFMKEMKPGDRALFYHSVKDKEVVGIAEIVSEAYQDPTTDDDRWVVVDVKPLKTLPEPVTLKAIKADSALQDIPLIKQSRLSVMPLSKQAFEKIVDKAKN